VRPTSLGWISDKLASMRGSRSNSPTGGVAGQ